MARAFEVILHNGVTGKIYNIGGTHEKANIEVAKDLLASMGKAEEEVRGVFGCGMAWHGIGTVVTCRPYPTLHSLSPYSTTIKQNQLLTQPR